MEFVKCYQDLCREIEIYEDRLESLIAQHDAIVEGWLKPISDISGIDYSAPRVQENHCKLDMMEQLPQIEALEKDIEKYKLLLDKVKDCQKAIVDRIKNMDGIEYRIAYMVAIEGDNLKKIALKLNYSYSYIRKIHSKILWRKDDGEER
ncbi:hypothetical protein SANA_23030 [Gottschalkiaceae bacterium SANA]|nr:hypothetical protein SANA_23030 [Gottschalkiaceae bacterium SANA]